VDIQVGESQGETEQRTRTNPPTQTLIEAAPHHPIFSATDIIYPEQRFDHPTQQGYCGESLEPVEKDGGLYFHAQHKHIG
jgi:hypothetical protein